MIILVDMQRGLESWPALDMLLSRSFISVSSVSSDSASKLSILLFFPKNLAHRSRHATFLLCC